MHMLGLETSCDETAAAVVKDGKHVLSNIISSQAQLHAKYGGVVPEVASRMHLERLPLVVKEALDEAKVKPEQIDAVAVTKNPGLPPALIVGRSYASGLALSLNKPLIEVDHLEAHVYANFLVDDERKKDEKELEFPHLCLLVSGGHTSLLFVKSPTEYKELGSTRDDAAGEAFDKIARLLDLGYPGGPIIDKLAKEGDEKAIDFPRAMMESGEVEFSFSGLKTAVRRLVEKRPVGVQNSSPEHSRRAEPLRTQIENNWKSDVAASFQEAVVDVLVWKTVEAAQNLGVDTITLAGGVAANSRLREQMIRAAHQFGYDVRFPDIKFCLDNAAMVAGRAYHSALVQFSELNLAFRPLE